MGPKNLWGELPPLANVRTPVSVLKEQAAHLTEMTKGVLVGMVVSVVWKSNLFAYQLVIRAPALNAYEADILMIGYDITLYPLRFANVATDGAVLLCDTEEAFIAQIETVLTSESVRRIVVTLFERAHSAKRLHAEIGNSGGSGRIASLSRPSR